MYFGIEGSVWVLTLTKSASRDHSCFASKLSDGKREKSIKKARRKVGGVGKEEQREKELGSKA